MRSLVSAAAIAAATFIPTVASGAILEVGAGKPYATIQAAASKAVDGDTILISKGTYKKGAVFTANNLTIKGAPGTTASQVNVETGIVNSKGLFNIKGDNVTVEGIRFGYAKAADGNGAGIRAEGMNLTVRASIFRRNEMGILATPAIEKAGSALTVEGSTFTTNGTKVSGHIGHEIYAAEGVGTLIVRDSRFETESVGHYIKSRALDTIVERNIIDDTYGTASYLIELPEGGAGTIANNKLIKGPNASNCCNAIVYGSEMRKGGSYINPPGAVFISENTFTNKRESSVTFVHNMSTPPNEVVLIGNTLIAKHGRITPIAGPGSIDGIAQPSAGLARLNLDNGAFSLRPGDGGTVASSILAPGYAAVPGPAGLLASITLGSAVVFRRRRRA